MAIQMATDLLKDTHARRSNDFVGVGVVLYVPPVDFPAVPLGGWSSARPELPVTGAMEISQALVALSEHGCAWHDGFHFVDAQACALTHVSQFLAPSLSLAQAERPDELPTGARQLTALLVSHPAAHLVGPHVDEVIDLFALAIRHNLTADDLKRTMFAYPSGASDIGYML